MGATIPPEAHRLLDEANFAYVATVMADGSPQTTPVWAERDGDTVLFNRAKGRAKAENLARDPRVAVTVHDPGTRTRMSRSEVGPNSSRTARGTTSTGSRASTSVTTTGACGPGWNA